MLGVALENKAWYKRWLMGDRDHFVAEGQILFSSQTVSAWYAPGGWVVARLLGFKWKIRWCGLKMKFGWHQAAWAFVPFAPHASPCPQLAITQQSTPPSCCILHHTYRLLLATAVVPETCAALPPCPPDPLFPLPSPHHPQMQAVYDLFMLPHQPGVRALVIGIANSIDLTERALPALKLRGCTPTLVPFPAYTTAQVMAILRSCLEQVSERCVGGEACAGAARALGGFWGGRYGELVMCFWDIINIFAARVWGLQLCCRLAAWCQMEGL